MDAKRMHALCLAGKIFLIALLTCPVLWAQDPPPAETPPPPAEAPPPAADAPPPGPVDVRQVQVKVWISETNETGVREIGSNLNFTRFVRGEEQSTSLQQIRSNTTTEGISTTTLPYPDEALFGKPMRPDISSATGLQTYSGAGIEFSIIKADYGTIDGMLQTMETRTDADLISKPELVVANGLKAVIKAGEQIPFQDVQYPKTAAGRGTPELQVNWRDVGMNMSLTPTIMPNDYIQLNIDTLEVSEVSRLDNLNGLKLPVFSSRSQTGVVFVPDGTTLVIGGLTSRSVLKSEQRIPFVGSIPLLGIPFRGRKSDAKLTSLLIFVAPTIVDMRAPTPQANSALHFWREHGSSWENQDRIESEVNAMESGL